MLGLEKYPSLRNLINLLSMTIFPVSKQDDPVVNAEYGEEVIGELTAGEANLYLAVIEADGAFREANTDLGEEDELPAEVLQKAVVAHFLDTNFWMLLHQRLAAESQAEPPRIINVRRGFQIVRCFDDCGCDKGLQCTVVKSGLIDPETGKEKIPNSADEAVMALALIQSEGSEECIEWGNKVLLGIGKELNLFDSNLLGHEVESSSLS
jgi:hypothetical protein